MNASAADCEKLYEVYPQVPQVSHYAQASRCRYLLILDGNGWPARLPLQLSTMGSTVVLSTVFTTWSTRMLRPFRHYLPLPMEYHMSALPPLLDWLELHSAEARHIALEGKRFAELHMRPIDMLLYTMLFVLEYADLCDFTEY